MAGFRFPMRQQNMSNPFWPTTAIDLLRITFAVSRVSHSEYTRYADGVKYHVFRIARPSPGVSLLTPGAFLEFWFSETDGKLEQIIQGVDSSVLPSESSFD